LATAKRVGWCKCGAGFKKLLKLLQTFDKSRVRLPPPPPFNI
jgi:hypothetical protein